MANEPIVIVGQGETNEEELEDALEQLDQLGCWDGQEVKDGSGEAK